MCAWDWLITHNSGSASLSEASRWGRQEKALRAGVEVLLATPGRLLDHMRLNQARFDLLHTLVLDEADRMLDMGFLPDLKRIIARLPAREQTLFFSATMPPVIVTLAGDILRHPVRFKSVMQHPGGGYRAGGLPGRRAPQKGTPAALVAAHGDAFGAGLHAHQGVGPPAGTHHRLPTASP